MTTDHINRWNLMSDDEFLDHAKIYRRFKNVSGLEHNINLDYIVKRCQKLGYTVEPACCGKHNIVKTNG